MGNFAQNYAEKKMLDDELALCEGMQDTDGLPCCSGPDIRELDYIAQVQYCADCAMLARESSDLELVIFMDFQKSDDRTYVTPHYADADIRITFPEGYFSNPPKMIQLAIRAPNHVGRMWAVKDA